MDKLNIKNVNKLNSIKDRYIKLLELYNGNFKKKLILFDDINDKLNQIENLLDMFEINNESDIKLNEEFEKRINNNKQYKMIIDVLSPYLIFFILYKMYNI